MGIIANVKYQSGNQRHDIKLSVFTFTEDGIYFVYSPALDLTGYGETLEKAKESFEITIKEFLEYTSNKATLFKELERLGWTTNKKKKRAVPPTLHELLTDNPDFANLYNNKNPQITKKSVSLAL